MKVVIIGGVAGGATAAARLRRLNEEAEIIILERSGFVSYANCGLPYYVGGVITDKKALTLQTPASFWNRFRIDVRVKNEALEIDTAKKTVRVRRLEDGGEYTESYDKLVLSPGARAMKPDVPGIDSGKIMTLRTVEDTYRIREFIEKRRPESAVVVGGGFIGLEAAENLMGEGIKTSLLQRSAQVMPQLDYDMACQVHAYLRDKGLDLRLNSPIEKYEETDGGVRIKLKSGEELDTDFVMLAVGVEPDTQLAKQAGLELGRKNSIAVNEYMEASAPDVYAVGDAVEVRNFVTGQKALIALAGPANKQGRIAADNICGIRSKFSGSQASSVIKIFDMTVAATGINEKTAHLCEMKCDSVLNYSASHATYYPGSTDMTIKTVFDPQTYKILGAQIVGFEGVDKRIDVMAAAIRAGMTAEGLEELDLAYAPPYSSAKDPVNMAGFTIGNIRDGLVKQYHWSDIEALQRAGDAIMLDTRTVGEYAQGHIPGTVNIPLDELRDRLEELDRAKPVYVNCYSGLRSYIACRILTQHGFESYNLSGGYRFYSYVAEDKSYDAEPTHPCGIKIEK